MKLCVRASCTLHCRPHCRCYVNNINDKLLRHVLATQVSPAEGNVSFERYASAGHALTVHEFTMGLMHRSALAQHYMAAVAALRHSCTRCKLAYYGHCHARLYTQYSCLSCLFVTLSNTQGSAL